MDIQKILAEKLIVQVPVKVHMETGYCGSDSTDTIFVDVEDVTDFIEGTFIPSIDEDISQMAWDNAQSYGEDLEDCGECEGCENNDGCEDPQESQSVGGSGTLFRKDQEHEIDNLQNRIPLYIPEAECYVVIELGDMGDRIANLEKRAMDAEQQCRTLSSKVSQIRRFIG